MCGICGFFNINGISSEYKDLIYKISESLYHRGPDDSGYYFDDFCVLAHRRLSIIDLKTGHQPMFDSEKKVVIVFNGEIYNFKELKKNLISYGYNFKTESDTEVIIYSYIHWGEDFVNYLNGMFAFAIYDIEKKAIFLYRDRLGIKPIYYTFFNDYLIFSSEPHSLFFFPIKKEIDKESLSHYLTSHQIHFNDKTLYNNVFLLKKSHYLKIDRSNNFIKKEYWSIPFGDYNITENEAVEYVKESVRLSVENRLISDVPLGAYLSGGVDSSIIVANIKDNINTFSIGFNLDGYNEFEYSNFLNKFFNIKHYNYFFNEDEFFKLNNELINFKGFPLNVPNEVLLYYLSKRLKEYITVVLSGEGADELFGGYGLFLRSVHDYCKLFLLNKCPDFFSEDIVNLSKDSLLRLYGNINFLSIEKFLYNIYTVFNYDEKSYLLNFKNDDNVIIDFYSKILNKCEKESFYDKFLYFLENYHLEGLLLRNDNATMAASVECRVPFTDYKLVEKVFNLPFKYKIKWKNSENQINAFVSNASEITENFDTTKYILRKSFKGIVPDKILKRKKMSFPVPLNEWFNSSYRKILLENFENRDSLFYEYFNYNSVNSFINGYFNGKNGLKAWMLYNIKVWMDQF